jgi:hypothetical protein
MKHKYFLFFILFSAYSSAKDVVFDISWQGTKSSFTYFDSDWMHKEGELYKVFNSSDVTKGFYIERSSFLGLFTFNNKYEGEYEYTISLDKNHGGKFQLTGNKKFTSIKNEETVNSSLFVMSKSFIINDVPQCIDKDDKYPTLSVCISYGKDT